ncbi:hypothetical protein QI095_04145 [Staphylococcus saprophyticus]|nr:hypothetical protein [Staphylococcus saprophyticus]MDW4459664.1 hypothetical protein [Staphylococcus saprophyticus]MDW4467155.1 hypothetical protein [Staphylococcus saprophyticus]
MRYLYNSGNRYGTVVTRNNTHRVIMDYPREVFNFTDEELKRSYINNKLKVV